jgi:hypothetical protein
MSHHNIATEHLLPSGKSEEISSEIKSEALDLSIDGSETTSFGSLLQSWNSKTRPFNGKPLFRRKSEPERKIYHRRLLRSSPSSTKKKPVGFEWLVKTETIIFSLQPSSSVDTCDLQNYDLIPPSKLQSTGIPNICVVRFPKKSKRKTYIIPPPPNTPLVTPIRYHLCFARGDFTKIPPWEPIPSVELPNSKNDSKVGFELNEAKKRPDGGLGRIDELYACTDCGHKNYIMTQNGPKMVPRPSINGKSSGKKAQKS